jgi:hypothetical protein
MEPNNHEVHKVYEAIRLSKENIGRVINSCKSDKEFYQILAKDEKQLLDFRSKLPVGEIEVHLKLARQLFDLYAIGRYFGTMNGLIEETIKVLSLKNIHPLFEVDTKNYLIRAKENILCFDDNIKYFKQALELFPSNESVYCKISPFGFGTDCVCYKSANEKTKKIISDDNDSSSEELRTLELISEIRTTHLKVKINFTFGNDDF